ncbi:hypothetical protein IWX91DRAFT_333905, partial [Phyllosticta citricarpa]
MACQQRVGTSSPYFRDDRTTPTYVGPYLQCPPSPSRLPRMPCPPVLVRTYVRTHVLYNGRKSQPQQHACTAKTSPPARQPAGSPRLRLWLQLHTSFMPRPRMSQARLQMRTSTSTSGRGCSSDSRRLYSFNLSRSLAFFFFFFFFSLSFFLGSLVYPSSY